MTCGNFFLFRWVCVIGDPAPRIDHAALKIVAVLGEIVFDVGQLTSINHVHYLDGGLGKYVG